MATAQSTLQSNMQTATMFSAFAGLATSFLSFIFINNSATSAIFPYLGYIVIVPCVFFGWFSPFAAVLSSFILLPVNPGFPIAHTFTSAPSDYMIVAATLCLIVKGRPQISLRGSAILSAALLTVSATITLSASVAGLFAFPIDRFFIAEYAGLISMACYIAAPAMVVRQNSDFVSLSHALAFACLVLFAAGALGAIDTLACISTGSNEMFTSAGFRDKGLLGDPNIFGIFVASLIPILIWVTQPVGSFCTLAATWIGAGLIICSGSRTAIFVGCLSVALAGFLSIRTRMSVATIYASTLVLLVFAPTIAWPRLPCPIKSPDDRVSFTERSAGEAYFARMLLETKGAESLLLESAPLRRICLNGSDVLSSPPTAARSPEVEKCVFDNLRQSFQEPGLDADAYKKTPWLTSLLERVPLDKHRRLLWEHAFTNGLENPLLGIGLSNLSRVTPRNWRSHNTFLTTFAEQGLIGLTLFALVLGFALFSGVRALTVLPVNLVGMLRMVLIGGFVSIVGSFSQDMTRQPIVWALIGFLAASSSLCPAPEGKVTNQGQRSPTDK